MLSGLMHYCLETVEVTSAENAGQRGFVRQEAR